MNEKLIQHLSNGQLELTRALYYDRLDLSLDDEFILREAQTRIPKIIDRLEKEEICAKNAEKGIFA